MGMGPWERQRDLLALKRADAQSDLAALLSTPLAGLSEDSVERVERLIKIVKGHLAKYDRQLILAEEEMERERGLGKD